MVKLEFLPNEILIECFEYLNAFDIFHSFDQLNSRFNYLIRHIPLSIDIGNVKQSILEEFFTKMLLNSEIKNQIYSIKFSNDYKCLRTGIFLSFFSLDEFIYLRKFKSTIPLLSSSNSSRKINPTSSYIKVRIDDLLHKNYLQTLSILEIDYPIQSFNQTSIINLTISWCSLTQLYHFLLYIPMLKYLRIQCVPFDIDSTEISFDKQYGFYLKEIIIDKFRGDFNLFEKLLHQTLNLKSLIICSSDDRNIINADRWKYIITTSLPSLNIFRFYFDYYCYENEHREFINKFQQFQTDFWLKQNHWHIEYNTNICSAYIYTIPRI